MKKLNELKFKYTSNSTQIIIFDKNQIIKESCHTIFPVEIGVHLSVPFPFLEPYTEELIEEGISEKLDCVTIELVGKRLHLDFTIDQQSDQYIIFLENHTITYQAREIIQQKRNEYFIYSEHLEQMQKEKDLFFQKINHEIRNPLQNSLLMLERMKEDHLVADKRLLHTLINNIESAAYIAEDILEIAKLKRGHVNIRNKTNKLVEVLSEIEEKHRYRLEINNNKIVLDLDVKYHHCYYLFDKLRINQIFDNLIINANKFTQNGTITFGVENHVDLGAFYKFSFYVKDTGVGMTQNQADQIFDDFVQVANEQAQKGFGLGLAIVKQYVKLYSGKIKAFSEKTIGTIIRFDLTFEKSSERDRLIENHQLTAEGVKILLVDDDPISLLLLKAGFVKQKSHIDTARTVGEAIDKLKINSYDFVITDYNLNEEYTAYDIKNKVGTKDSGNVMKWIILSGDSIKEEEFKERGFHAAIQKPANLNKILKVINRLQSCE
ncbi:MAG: ATP-binding protein [Flavobacteriales bacterium]|jgi:signal transduction histidine kinase/ActR/RegA family two-component response regulator|nr:ATP-binding protein [Flavobacteriales bacterium]